ncbi:MAG: sialidase family protein [Pirellulales bacterium]
MSVAAILLTVAFVWSTTSSRAVAEELENDFIEVRNPKILPARISCQRIALGEPDDYKPSIARLLNGELLMVAFRQHRLGKRRIREDLLLFRSKDGGRTWSQRESRSDVPGREYYLTALKNGTLMMTVHLIR